MSIRPAFYSFLLAVAVCGCNSNSTPAERELQHVWTAPKSSVEERAVAINRCFTNGTPISSVVALLGTNHSRFSLIAIYWCGEPRLKQALDLTYDFGADSVIIKVTADEHAAPISGYFTEARFSNARTNSINIKQ